MDEHPFHHPFHNLKEASMLVWALSSEIIASQLFSKPAPHTPKARAEARAALRPRHQLREKAKRGTALQWIASHRKLEVAAITSLHAGREYSLGEITQGLGILL